MKKLFFLPLLLSVGMTAMGQRIMKVEKTDGTVIECPVKEVKRVFFEGEEPVASSCPDANHPHMIDLGIGTLWACCNVGASAPEQYGNYYAWGETQPKSEYSLATYQHWVDSDGDGDASDSEWTNLGKDISGTEYDAARVNWGAPWRMPTVAELQTLTGKCTSEWTAVNGVNGRKFTGPNGKSIFLPAAGGRWGGELLDAGSDGGYWSSALNEGYPYGAYDLNFGSGGAYWDYGGRYGGQSVRPVR